MTEKTTGRTIIKLIIVFIILAALMMGLLVLAAMIPKDKIRDNMLESAEYLSEGEVFGEVMEGVRASTIDRYADSILLNIAWNYDPDDLLGSVMLSSYYFTEYQDENINLLDAVRDGKEPNHQYLRYWHGSNAIVRPLMLLFSVRQMYILNAVILVLLFLLLEFLCIKKQLFLPAVGMPAALILTAAFFVPLSLEYTWIFLIMFVSTIIALCIGKKGWDQYAVLFLITGMVTSFLDFLTAETLTLTIPLLFVLFMKRESRDTAETDDVLSGKDEYGFAMRSVICWGAGYILMWLLKWLMAALILGENVMPYVSEHIKERLGGDIKVDAFGYLTGAITRNLGSLFPISYGPVGAVAGVILIVIAAYFLYVYRRKDYDRKWVLLCILTGAVPYVRYLVLHNHSYLHSFFTCRAQAATILAFIFIIFEVTGFADMMRGKGSWKKNGKS
ncbi:MAG: hypothetical protein K5886_06080 [Lachnospiraceae bacterium]|nr:hypothetical protein [Lachnospiraceae bacterium]